MKICISTTSFAEFDRAPLELCLQRGHEVILNPHGRKVTPDELVEIAHDADGLLAGTESLKEEVLLRLPGLKVISRCGTGLDNVDLAAAKRLGIRVFNTPDAPTLAVAELTVGLMLNLLRKITMMDAATKGGAWDKLMGTLLHDKTVGILGLGRIGRKVAELLSVFQCPIVYSDPHVKDGLLGFRRMALPELLVQADLLSLHVSSKERLLGRNELRSMKRGAWLVNVSRGDVIDEAALYECLSEGHLSGAALDVFEQEPYTGPLRGLPNVILTPHVGSYAVEARTAMEREAVEHLLAGLESRGGS